MYMEEGTPPYNISREALIGGYNGSVINLLPAMIYVPSIYGCKKLHNLKKFRRGEGTTIYDVFYKVFLFQ